MVTLLTRRSRFGTRAVELAVAAGGVLIAVAIFVPGMPLAFTLAGVLLLLAGLSAAALLTKQARGVGWRLLAAAVLVAAALGGYAYWDYSRNGTASAVWSLGIKVGIGVLVVLLGWWVARAQPIQRKRTRPAQGRPLQGRAAGEKAGEKAGKDAGRDAGEKAGEAAGALAGKVAGGRAGEEAAKAAGKAVGTMAGEVVGEAVGEAAGTKAGRKDGEAAGRSAGEEAQTALSRRAGEFVETVRELPSSRPGGDILVAGD